MSYLNSTLLLHAADVVRITWSERVFQVSDTSPRFIDREGLGRRHTGTGQIQTLAVKREECYLDLKESWTGKGII